MRDRIAAGGVSEEDERSADWIDLLRTRPVDALVLGCGHGAAASALAMSGARVTAVDASEERLSFLRVRAQQSGQEVSCAHSPEPWMPPAAGPFDLVAYLDPSWPGGADPGRTASDAAGLLRPGGQIAWRADARIGGRRRGARGASLRTLSSALRREGFADIRVYAPLPDRGVPLFHVPLAAGGAMNEFLRAVLPLVLTAPSATRRRHGLTARLAGIAPLAARLPGLARVAELLVPGWLVLATYRGGQRAR